MEYIEVTGGNPLRGSIRPAAAKNSVLPLLAATLLCAQPCTLRRVPLLRDVQTSLDLLRAVGSGAAWAGQDLVTQPARQISGRVPTALAGAMRGSVFYLAPLLTRAGWAELPLPGGCRLGPRPIDIHLAGLTAMGAQVCAAAECVALRRHGVLRGTDFALRLPSVGATLTLMLAACCAAGVTTLRGAACEPEIADTAAFLNACGAKITGAGTPVVCIRGTGGELLDGCVHTVLPDRIAAATYAAAAAIAGGRVTVTQCSPVWLAAFLDFLQGSGCEVARGENEFSITRDQDTKLRGGQELVAAAYPGLATDTAPLAAAVLLGAEGASRIYDGLFQNRFACAQGFAALGADARSEGFNSPRILERDRSLFRSALIVSTYRFLKMNSSVLPCGMHSVPSISLWAVLTTSRYAVSFSTLPSFVPSTAVAIMSCPIYGSTIAFASLRSRSLIILPRFESASRFPVHVVQIRRSCCRQIWWFRLYRKASCVHGRAFHRWKHLRPVRFR